MFLRPQSELGWLMLQWLAVLVLGHNVQKDPSLLGGSRRGGKTAALVSRQGNHEAAKPRQVKPRDPGSFTLGPAPLWWLSFASEADVFLGLAIVEARNHTEAVQRTLTLGINPGGQVAAIEIPADLRATHEPYRDRLLTEDEARALEAKPIREWEETGDLTPEMLEHLAASGQLVTHTQPPPEFDATAFLERHYGPLKAALGESRLREFSDRLAALALTDPRDEGAGYVDPATGEPDEALYKVPGALLNVTRAFAVEMGLDPEKLERV